MSTSFQTSPKRRLLVRPAEWGPCMLSVRCCKTKASAERMPGLVSKAVNAAGVSGLAAAMFCTSASGKESWPLLKMIGSTVRVVPPVRRPMQNTSGEMPAALDTMPKAL